METLSAQVFVPGSGRQVMEVGDDMEDPNWEFVPNFPKASKNIDGDLRLPAGESKNGRWYESTFRGQPDSVKRVPTPPGGLEGSTGAIAFKTMHSGIPGRISYKMQQDDMILNCSSILGYAIPVSSYPSVVTRVYMPPFEQWEDRAGSHFGFRADVTGTGYDKTSNTGARRFFRRGPVRKTENYWPGFFIQYNGRDAAARNVPPAVLLIRGDQNGHEFTGPAINEPGWWTLGMSFSPDGQVHFFAKPGVGKLTMQDHVGSQFPYGYTAERFNTFFFNIVNQDDGRSWSTEFVVDDPQLFLGR